MTEMFIFLFLKTKSSKFSVYFTLTTHIQVLKDPM